MCLNRTSVGLKRRLGRLGGTRCRTCLNRTSVGLKRAIPRSVMPIRAGPQSNQRGIETSVDSDRIAVILLASIEPAWD